MPFLLAEVAATSTPDANALKAWLEVLAYLCGIVLMVAGVYKLLGKSTSHTAIANQPVGVKEVHDLVTTAQLAKVEKELKDDLTNGARSRKEMHREIEILRVAQARLEEKTDGQTRQLNTLDQKMDQVLLRLPRG